MIVSIEPTSDLIAEARQRYTGRQYNRHTMEQDGKGQLIGDIAELAFRDWLNSKGLEHYHAGPDKEFHDFVIGSRKIDVKAKRRTKRVNLNYDEGHVEIRLKGADCDYYVFVSVLVPKDSKVPTLIELVGYIPTSRFWCSGLLMEVRKGEETSTGFFEKADAGKLVLKHMESMDKLADRIELYLYKRAFGELE